MKLAFAAFALAVLAAAGPVSADGRTAKGEDGLVEPDRPIIAGILADPRKYLGHRVEIYGLVVGTEASGKHFFLQDVSGEPMPVIGPTGTFTVGGDQLIVAGTVRYIQGRLGIEADAIRLTRVLAGGGCC